MTHPLILIIFLGVSALQRNGKFFEMLRTSKWRGNGYRAKAGY
jgi:hypothetical protein